MKLINAGGKTPKKPASSTPKTKTKKGGKPSDTRASKQL